MRRFRLLILISAASLAVSGVAYGSGFSIFEQRAKATAMGGAFAATADDHLLVGVRQTIEPVRVDHGEPGPRSQDPVVAHLPERPR